MIDHELLRDPTESYLKSLISEVSGSLSADFDSLAPFGEMGIDSFHVLKIIKRLEADFGTLPKSLLFENFNINDLANYFVVKHQETLVTRFAEELQGPYAYAAKPVEVHAAVKPPEAPRANPAAREAEPIRILEKDAYAHPELQELVRTLFRRHGAEGSVSRGTRKIAPNLFIGSSRRGYFNYGRSNRIILVYGYAGPLDYLPTLLEEMHRYCETKHFQLNVMAGEDNQPAGAVALSATPFGVMQRILKLKEFTLDGGAMRRLRYQVSKFQRAGACRTEEYRCGSNPETDKDIARVIDAWCEGRTMINPLVNDVRGEILAGTLPGEHRLFLTYLDGVLQNVIVITAMSEEENGYLMDLEFYPREMPLGGLEFTIVQMIGVLAGEGCDVLSLGGTYGCKLNPSPHADPEIDRILDGLREQKIFNDQGNLQFKNKFNPENSGIYLCRPVRSGNADNVIDIIMMIADPEKLQTSDVENHNFPAVRLEVSAATEAPARRSMETAPASSDRPAIECDERSRALADSGFNPLNIPNEKVDFDLKTDSWSQLSMPAIEAQMKQLHAQLQQPVSVDDSLRSVFPFAHFVLTASGQAAEHLFFKAWPRQGVVLQNLLFPSTIFHQIDKGFTARELPHPEVFQLNSREPYKGNIDWDALEAEVAQDPAAIALVCIEVSDNAAGGYPVSLQHLRSVKALLAPHSIPLVIDATRVVENAQFLIEHDKEQSGRSLWAVVRDILSSADAVIGSLTKDFCVNKGGIIATNDETLFRRLQELVHEEGSGIDLIDEKLIALSLQNRKHIEAKVLRRIEGVRLIGQALSDGQVPMAYPAGGHCILIDVRRIPGFKDFGDPIASFLAWLYLNTGIRAGAHSAGMQKRTVLNDLVRLAIPVGLKRERIDTLIERFLQAFGAMANIPEVVVESSAPQPSGRAYSKYRLVKYHNVPESLAGRADASQSAPVTPIEEPARGVPQGASAPAAEQVSRQADPAGTNVNRKPRGTQDIAIVGMAGRYPKAANVRELWENLARGTDCIEELPAERYERRLQLGSAEKYRGGFIDNVDKFDSIFFNISPREAEMLDPQERLFLEVAWEAVEDAGYFPEILAREDASRNIGVFVGAVWSMYQIAGVDEKHAGNKVAPNSFLWSIANRVSYWMNLAGPSLTVDTACSSSLTALYLACEAILSGECPAAIVGGVNLDLHQAKIDINQVGGALSPDGICRTFGKGANGYVAGEGIGALLLKPLEQAVEDGDHIYGLIKSAVVNHGGRTSGYFVPNPAAQSNVIVSALRKANVGAASIGYIEAHGTGTELGDPIEISGLSNAFSADKVGNQTCAIGSIKSNIGHLEAAAGVVSVSKVLLQMKHRQLVPSLHSSELNEFIDFEHSPFYVVQKLEEWKAKEVDGVRLPLRAGISSFGAGGANAHVILESYEPAETVKEAPAQLSALIFPFSARNEEQLRETAVRFAKFLGQTGVDLEGTAYTLQHGRKSFEHRLAVVARTQEELLDKLRSFIDGKKADGLAAGNVKQAEGVTRLLNRREKQEFFRLLSQGRDPQKIAGLWAEGLLADWQGFPASGSGKRVSLPTYPFAGKRHWVGDPSAVRRPSTPSAVGLHPILDSNESTFERQLFRKTFNDRDFFIYDHHVAGVPTLPGVAYLEFARKAGEIAAGRPVKRIQNILWVSPIAVESSVPKEVFIELKPSGEAVQFEVFSTTPEGVRTLHSQGKLLYTNRQDGEPEQIDLDAIRARCGAGMDGKSAYPLFKSVGLNLGPSFQVLQEVYKSNSEVLGVLKLPEFRRADLESMVLHPSLVDGSLQAGMAARLGDSVGEMLVPYSIGEVEILHPLQSSCYSYTTESKEGKKGSRVLKSNVLILDETGKVLARIRESTGVPLGDVFKKGNDADAGFSKLYYSYDWVKAPLTAEDAGSSLPQSMLLFDTDETLRDLYAARLHDVGAAAAQVILVRPGQEFRELDGLSYELDPRNKEGFNRLFESLAGKNVPVDEVCFAWPASHTDFVGDDRLKESLEQGVSSFLFLSQALVQAKIESKAQLLYVYGAKAGKAQPHNEAVSGFVKTLHGEYPKLLCKTLEIQNGTGGRAELIDALWSELRGRAQDSNVVCYEAQERYVRKLVAFDLEPGTAPDVIGLKDEGVYLITGGAGGLGLLFAEYLAKQYKARLVLTGRSTLSAEREAKLDELRTFGAEVLYVIADVSDREAVRNLIAQSKARFGELHGVIHSAGVVRDSYIKNKTAEEMRAVFAPKVHGTMHLDELTSSEPLDFFVMFSSLAAITGNVGQADYSFANRFMDSLAADRERLRARGERSGKTLSINWSLWADGGMKPDEQTELLLRKAMGMKPLSAATGLEAFVLGLGSERSQFVVVEGIQEKLEQAWGGKKKTAPAADPAASSEQTVSGPVADEGDGDLRAQFQRDLSQIVMDFLKLDASDMSEDKILLDLGFDSIGLTTFANAVNEKFHLEITPILFFDYPSVGEIAKHLALEQKSELLKFYRGSASAPATPLGAPASAAHSSASGQAGSQQAPVLTNNKGWDPSGLDRGAEAPAAATAVSPELRFVHDPIAIVGMSGVMPQSDDLDEFWDNLKNSKDLVTVIPPDRWRWDDYYGDPLKEANKSNSKWGGFMREVDKFDPLFFGISPREAQMMDPQQRIFLEQVWKAIEDSGQKVSDLSGTKTGLFLGAGTTDYAGLLSSKGVALDGYTASGNSHSVTANRVSFLLNLRGPSAPIDTACSSSLIAFHRAIESIHSGSCDMAIVGGVQVMLSPAAYISFGMAGMLSGDGKCKTFDKDANGYVRGEGCGAVFLKPLSAAVADGNHIYALIKSTAENHGGRVTTMTAPNSVAQTDLLIEAYEKAHIDPTTVGYIECHGTGTGLGDPIEVQALSKAFAELYKRNGKPPAEVPHCGLSSVKTNIGHLETGAGIAGVLKALLAIKHHKIPANLHFKEINPYINLKGTPFYIADKLTPWEAAVGEDGLPVPRRAGVSSFGFGGANAHVVLEEYIPLPRHAPAAAHGPQLIVLSAKNQERLEAYVRSMEVYLAKGEVELVDIAYTLQVGRDDMPERLALVAETMAQLKQKLSEILEGGARPADSYRGNTRNKDPKAAAADGAEGEALVRSAIERKELSRLAEIWVSGAKIDWRLLHTADDARRISAPTYPFARERHWMPDVAVDVRSRPRTGQIGEAVLLHPMIHRNVSTLREQKFAAHFTGTEFFLEDHRVRTEPVLPAVAYVEMVAAAGELAGDQKVRVIRNMTWLAPLTVGEGGKDVEVSLAPGIGEVEFTVKTADTGRSTTHCRGTLAYRENAGGPEALNIDEIQARCADETLAGKDLYPFLSTSELDLGKSFQVVQKVYAGEAECLAVLQLPEHLKQEADRFWLHPALLDGALHTAIGVVKLRKPSMPWSVPYSVGEIQAIGSLKDAHYAHAVWNAERLANEDGPIRIQMHLLDWDGRVLVRMKDFVAKPFRQPAVYVDARVESKSALQSLVPIWNPLPPDASKGVIVPESSNVLLLRSDPAPLRWVRESYPNAQLLALNPRAGVEVIAQALADCPFDQLLWIAPDVSADAGVRETDERLIDRQEEGVLAVFRIIKALLQMGYANKSLQWTIVTGRTQGISEADPVQPAHAGVAGLVGSLAKEYPHWDLRLLDLDSLASVSARECLSLPWDKQGNGLAHRGDVWFQQGLVFNATLPQTRPAYRDHGVYVVIGGAGGVGEVWSRFMIEHYQANVVWIGRREPDAAIEAKIDALSKVGPAPIYISADATNLTSLERARNAILEIHPAIHGVVHSAVVLQDQGLFRMDEPGFKASLSAKVDISVNMDRVFGGEELDFMLFFSSIISFARAPGQSNYSAGCTFKDSFAHTLQQQRPYPVKIMNWGYWGNVGVVADEFHKKIMAQMGVGSIEPDEGMAALELLIGSETGQLALIKTLNGHKAAGVTPAEAAANPSMTEPMALPSVRSARTSEPAAARMTLTAGGTSPSAELSDPMSNDTVRQVITEKLSDVLRLDAANIGNDAPFADYGVDSIVGVNLVRNISEALQIQLEPTSLFECSTVNQLTEYIVRNCNPQIAGSSRSAGLSQEPSRLKDDVPADPGAATGRFLNNDLFAGAPRELDDEPHTEARSIVVEPIAIIGMSGRFAQSETLDQFWQHLEQGKDLVRTVSRWSTSDCVTPGSADQPYSSHGSFLDSADLFDPAFFRISPQEATYMDPQQRLFLEESWKALEDAGYAGNSVNGKQCGIYVGCGTSNYSDLFGEDPPPQAWWGNSQSVVPARIAYHLNLHGPAFAVDSACSSALVAIHLACQALWSRETEMAVAGGVYVQATSGFHQVANRAGMLSPEGKCYTFDARANGFVPGEAVGVVVLKRLRDAVKDGDHIHGVIAGSGINQDGSSNGLIAPNAPAQERLERAVYDRFGINPDTIQVVEAHGTGTILGDSIECLAITRAFRRDTDRKQFCAIGSVKTNIGHAGNAAGIAGLLKLLLSLRHRQIPPSLHFERGNPAIDFASSPFYVNTETRAWQAESGQKRRAAVSAFGFNGTNAHLVIEEAPSTERPALESPGYLVVLSARTAEQLNQQVRNLLAQVRQTPDLRMNDLSFTLFVGRAHFNRRLSCIARSQKELSHLLEQWLDTGAASQISTSELQERKVLEQPSFTKFGNSCIRECRNATDAVSYLEDLAAIADLYVQGYALDFPSLFPRGSKRMSLPTYPFARERHWVDAVRAAAPKSISASVPAEDATTEPAVHATWLFTTDATGIAGHNGSMGAAEKIELFLKQEAALQLRKPIESIPANQSHFDLGLTSLAIAHLIRNLNLLLEEDLSPSALFEYTDIQSLAAHLARTYPGKIEALGVRRAKGSHDVTREKRTPLSSEPDFSMARPVTPLPAAAPLPDTSRERMLEQVLWQEALFDDSYEKVTF